MALNAVALSAHIYPTLVRTLVSHYARRLTHFSRRPRSDEPGDLAPAVSHTSGSSSSSSPRPRPRPLFRARSHDRGRRARKRRSHAHGSDLADEQALYDLALSIARTFVKSMCRDTVEAIQAFANMPLPVPPHSRAQVAQVPPAAVHKAADVITDFFTGTEDDPQGLDPLLGGPRWWQVRPGPLKGEWVVPSRAVRQRAAEMGTRKRDRFRNMFRSTPLLANSRTSLHSSVPPGPHSSPARKDVDPSPLLPPPGVAAVAASAVAPPPSTGPNAASDAQDEPSPDSSRGRHHVSSNNHADEPSGVKLGQIVRGARRSMSTFRQASKQSTYMTAMGSDAGHTERTGSAAATSRPVSPAVTDRSLSPVFGDAMLSAEPEDESAEDRDQAGGEAREDDHGQDRHDTGLDQHPARDVEELLHVLSGRPPRRHGPASDSGEQQSEPQGPLFAESQLSDSEDEGEMVDGTDQDPFDIDPRRLNRIMLYCHGGAYYFGSNDTHRMMVARYARDIDGAAFSVTYRLAPQYPFPCGLHDMLAAYLYLISPSPDSGNDLAGGQSFPNGDSESRGRWGLGVDPARIILSGDSAGGGMILAMLQVLRDMGQPLPAGAALISPWCDLTHSFPSIMPNLKKDYIPDHGFVHKPSPLWPAPKDTGVPATAPAHPSRRSHLFGTHSKSTEKEGDDPASHPPLGHSVMESVLEKEDAQTQRRASRIPADEAREVPPSASTAHQLNGESSAAPAVPAPLKTELAKGDPNSSRLSASTPAKIEQALAESFGPRSHLHDPDITVEVPSTKRKGKGKSIKIQEQIQLYATNGQLDHPLVSPACAGSLGGLPPLYILAGNNEALRDEIVWVAHRAAHPDKYPCPPHLLQRGGRAVAAQQRFDSQPTPVHLQVWDDGVHVMPAFVFTYPGHLMYHSIASFCKAVVGAPVKHVSNEADQWVPEDPPDGTDDPDHGPGRHNFAYSKHEPIERPQMHDHMIRERVSVHGIVRPMEPEHLMSALTIPRDHVGVIQPGPAGLFDDIHREWEHKFKREPKRIATARDGVRAQAQSALTEAKADKDVVRGVKAVLSPPFQAGKAHHHHLHIALSHSSPVATKRSHAVLAALQTDSRTVTPQSSSPRGAAIDLAIPGPSSALPASPIPPSLHTPRRNKPLEARHRHVHINFTPLDLVGETPPPTAIAGRTDTVEALELLRLGIEEVRRRGQALRTPA